MFATPKDLDDAIEKYFSECDFKEKPYTISGLALALETNRQTLLNYSERPDYVDSLKKAKAKCEAYVEERLFGNTQVTGAIFNLKNNYGWVDKQDMNLGGQKDNPVEANLTVTFVKPGDSAS